MRTCAIFLTLHIEFETAPTFPCVGALRRMSAWRVFNALTTDFCLDAVREAIMQDGGPEIFQGFQFTSHEFTGTSHSSRHSDQHGRHRLLAG